MKTIKPASVGPVSHGTLKTEDLLSSFIGELDWQIRRNGDFFSHPENFAFRDRLNALVGEGHDQFALDGETIPDEKLADALEIIDEIQETLSELFAPRYCYFGTHPGDGSDFGYWPDLDSIEELPTLESGVSHPVQDEDYKTVNDHGNVTIHAPDGTPILELV